jgi:hypothetical protein
MLPRAPPTGQGRQPEDADTPGPVPGSSVSSLSDERSRQSSEPDTVLAKDTLTGRPAAGASLDVERLRRELRRHVAEIRDLLGQDIPRRRQILRRLLVGRLECEAFDEGKRVGYRFTARGSYVSLLPAELSTPEMVTPAGFEPAFTVRHALS